jgi:predicted DNA binding CopG/RHH family protein
MKRVLPDAELADIKSMLLAMRDEPVHELIFAPEELEYDFHADLREIMTTPATTGCAHAIASFGSATGSKKISIRIPAQTLLAFKTQAENTGVKYQRLINIALKATAASWNKSSATLT